MTRYRKAAALLCAMGFVVAACGGDDDEGAADEDTAAEETAAEETAAEETAAQVRDWIASGLVNVVGGCCGTTPRHIAAIAGAARESTLRVVPAARSGTLLAGLEPMLIAA